MKILHILLLFLIVSCSSNQVEVEVNYKKADSVLQNNKTTVFKSDSIDKKSEKIITKKINQAADKIQTLKTEVKHLKVENHELKTIIFDIDNDPGQPYFIRAISDN